MEDEAVCTCIVEWLVKDVERRFVPMFFNPNGSMDALLTMMATSKAWGLQIWKNLPTRVHAYKQMFVLPFSKPLEPGFSWYARPGRMVETRQMRRMDGWDNIGFENKQLENGNANLWIVKWNIRCNGPNGAQTIAITLGDDMLAAVAARAPTEVVQFLCKDAVFMNVKRCKSITSKHADGGLSKEVVSNYRSPALNIEVEGQVFCYEDDEDMLLDDLSSESSDGRFEMLISSYAHVRWDAIRFSSIF